MSAKGSGAAPGNGDTGSWTSETLPMSVRRELLERELKKLGFGHGATQGSAHGGGSVQQQQQPQGGGNHPAADGDAGQHGD